MVLAIILMMAGALAILQLPVASIQPLRRLRFLFRQTIRVLCADRAGYGDAGYRTEYERYRNLMYMSSTSDSAGSVTITLISSPGPILISRKCRCRTNSSRHAVAAAGGSAAGDQC